LANKIQMLRGLESSFDHLMHFFAMENLYFKG